MIELAKHIEVLLLENDCVIVPGLGGFIAHHHSSVFNKDTGEFLPPMRSIGFNPQLVMNDGLLVQSYMQAYNTDFPDATRKIENIVERLKDDLYQRGQISLNRLGTLYYNMNGAYEFEPVSRSFFTPSLYGLESISLKRLNRENCSEACTVQVKPTPEKVIAMPGKVQQVQPSIRRYGWIRNMVAAAVAIIMFFLMSPRVENTYVDNVGYAALGSTSIFDVIRNESVVSFIASGNQNQVSKAQHVKNNVNTLKPITVKTEKIVAQTEENVNNTPKEESKTVPAKAVDIPKKESKKVTPKAQVKKEKLYSVIVASLKTKEDAQKEIKKLAASGYEEARILESQGRYRIALKQFSKQEDAYEMVQSIKNKDARFKSAWVFTSK